MPGKANGLSCGRMKSFCFSWVEEIAFSLPYSTAATISACTVPVVLRVKAPVVKIAVSSVYMNLLWEWRIQ